MAGARVDDVGVKVVFMAFAVEKPSHVNGVSTLSVQFYDRAGAGAFKVFLNFGAAVTPERVEQFARLREQFRKASA